MSGLTLTEKQEARLVAWVNRQRDWRVGVKGRIRKLPKGIPDDACECVLARALGGRAQLRGDGTWDVTPWSSEPLPKYVYEFERRFDDGLYPDLIDPLQEQTRAEVADYYERVLAESLASTQQPGEGDHR